MTTPWRLELFFKSTAELRAQIPFIKTHQTKFLGVNITHKSKDENLRQTVQILQQEVPELDVCVHYSIKYAYHRSPQQTFNSLTSFLGDIARSKTGGGSSGGKCSVLLVSGSGKRKGLDSLSALQKLHIPGRSTAPSDLPLYVAFNPYLIEISEQAVEEEFKRLKEKLLAAPGRVSGVYLQMGTNMKALEKGLDYLESLVKEINDNGKFQIFGSVFIPSKKLLAQMRFRPWNGVFLSEEYLSGVEAAEKATKSLLNVYRQRGITPLIETSIKTEEQMEGVLKLLESFD